jgi:DNA-binding transcriptional LysR family regulator
MRPVADLQPLRAFVAVARAGSVSRAAAELNLTQPAVSLQLRKLADQAGLVLFNRKARGLELTAQGEALLAHAERVLGGLAEFELAVQSLHRTVRGRLRIGTILDPEFIRLGTFLKRLVETAPDIETELRQSMSGTVRLRVENGQLDVGFYLVDAGGRGAAVEGQPMGQAAATTSGGSADASTEKRRLDIRVLSRFGYRVVAPPGWGPRLRGLDWHGLATLPWLATPPQSIHHRLLATVFGPRSLTGTNPRRVALVDQEASMLDLVKSGVGLSLMRDSIAIHEQQVRGIAVADSVRLDCELTFVSLRTRREDPVIAAAWRALADAWPASGAQ